ncbi:Guanylate cyclase [Gryllus bimaculatus]|nr:Guanylate cyclase [Gryllus bimaculatus]
MPYASTPHVSISHVHRPNRPLRRLHARYLHLLTQSLHTPGPTPIHQHDSRPYASTSNPATLHDCRPTSRCRLRYPRITSLRSDLSHSSSARLHALYLTPHVSTHTPPSPRTTKHVSTSLAFMPHAFMPKSSTPLAYPSPSHMPPAARTTPRHLHASTHHSNASTPVLFIPHLNSSPLPASIPHASSSPSSHPLASPVTALVYSVAVAGAAAVFLALALTLACVAYKHVRVAADLNNMAWRVRADEVLAEPGRPFSSRLGLQRAAEGGRGGAAGGGGGANGGGVGGGGGGGGDVCGGGAADADKTSRRGSFLSCDTLLPAHVYTAVGIYKETRVAIKKVTIKKKLDINKKLLWEIKQVRDVTHENTVRFIGACIDTSDILILTEYCPKGSLRDVLENDELELDWNFRMSLIHDVVKVCDATARSAWLVTLCDVDG